MYHAGEETRLGPFPLMGNEHGQDLGMIPKVFAARLLSLEGYGNVRR